jgi:hypothetical protein
MARLPRQRKIPTSSRTDVREIASSTVPYWIPAKGIHTELPLERVPPEYTPVARNMRVVNGTLRSRLPAGIIGTKSTNIVGAVMFVTSTLDQHLLRFRTTVVERWNGSVWVTVAGTYTLTGSLDDQFTFVPWLDDLLFSNGVDGLFRYISSQLRIEKVTAGPAARHLSVFNGRVIASDVIDSTGKQRKRFRWSVKNSFTDWTGTGSGFEDLLSAPGGIVDRQLGVWPITDTHALVVRSRSIWQLSASGIADAPFRPNRLFSNVEIESHHAIALVPESGIIVTVIDDVLEITLGGIRRLAPQFRGHILQHRGKLSTAVALYEQQTQNYWLIVPADSEIMRYSRLDQAWTHHDYPAAVRWITPALLAPNFLTFDDLTGTFDALPGTFDDPVGAFDALEGTLDGLIGTFDDLADNVSREGGIIICTSEAVVQENATLSGDDFGDGLISSGVEARTKTLIAEHPLKMGSLLSARVHYESTASQTLLGEYSLDQGASWSAFSTKAIVPTAGMAVLRMQRFEPVTAYQVQFRLRSTTLGKLTILGLWLEQVGFIEVQGGGS